MALTDFVMANRRQTDNPDDQKALTTLPQAQTSLPGLGNAPTTAQSPLSGAYEQGGIAGTQGGPLAASPGSAGSLASVNQTPVSGRPFLLGFDTQKLYDPSSGSAAGSKYTDAAKAFGQAYLGGTDISRGNLGGMLAAVQQQFPNARAVGDDKIDFGDGNGPVDVIRSDGSVVFQNTTGNPIWEQQYGGPQAGAPQAGTLQNVMASMPAAAAGYTGGGGSAGNFSWTPLTAAQDFTPQAVQGPDPLSLAAINRPDAVTAQQVQAVAPINFQNVAGGPQVTPERVGAPQQVSGPDALTARNVTDPTGFQNLTLAQLQQDPSYQFRLQQGLQAMQQSAAAKGLLHTGGTIKALNDYAGDAASQEYQAANERARQTYQQNLTNTSNVIGQNNAAQAQAYGLTNQYQQQAALANQSANLQAALANQSAGNQANIFNSGQQQQNQQFNAANALGAQQFNAQQQQQAALANQQANLSAGQFNAGMNFNTQQQNLANQLAAYNAYQPLAQQNQQFNAQQAAAAAQNNFQNRFAVESANAQGGLNAYQANVNAELGRGGLANQAAANANSYNLGLGNLALGNRQADQSYALGLGNLGVAQGYLGQAGQNQAFNQGLQTFNTNYGVYRDNRDTSFQQNLALAQLGAGAAANYGNQAGALFTNQGNANAGATIGQGNAWAGALGNLGNAAQGMAYWNAANPGIAYNGGKQLVGPDGVEIPVTAGWNGTGYA